MDTIPKILVVDDIAANRLAIRTVLRGLDAEIVEADNGFDTLAMALVTEFALVLLDVQMPEMDGFEVCEQLRANPQTADLPVIFVTAASRADDDRLHGYMKGATDYLAKPINDQILKCKVQVFLRIYHQQRELQNALAAAQAANEAKSVFLANMSHELRTPMNGIMGMTDLALGRATDPKQQGYLERVRQASRHLLSIINDILDISRIEANRLRLEERDFNLKDLSLEITGLLSAQAVTQGLLLDAEIAPRLGALTLHGDSVRLRQVLLNLTGNALKFTQAGSVTVRVWAMEEDETQVLVRFDVHDTGVGISTEDQQRLFIPFQQVDGSMTRGFGGSGLGLAISKRLVEAMGGSIGVDSQPGVGSTFWFTVPLIKSEEVLMEPTAPQELPAAVVLKSRFAGARILLVEDEKISQEVTQFLLEDAGLTVDVADDGAQALDKLARGEYDLILMDMQMPKMNGLEATRAIRAMPTRNSVPIVAMTANAFDEDRQRCLEAGMTDFMAKPVRPDLLFEAVLRGLKQRR